MARGPSEPMARGPATPPVPVPAVLPLTAKSSRCRPDLAAGREPERAAPRQPCSFGPVVAMAAPAWSARVTATSLACNEAGSVPGVGVSMNLP